jgi:hypothetical protein
MEDGTLEAHSGSVVSTEISPRHMTLAIGVIRHFHVVEINLILHTSKEAPKSKDSIA